MKRSALTNAGVLLAIGAILLTAFLIDSYGLAAFSILVLLVHTLRKLRGRLTLTFFFPLILSYSVLNVPSLLRIAAGSSGYVSYYQDLYFWITATSAYLMTFSYFLLKNFSDSEQIVTLRLGKIIELQKILAYRGRFTIPILAVLTAYLFFALGGLGLSKADSKTALGFMGNVHKYANYLVCLTLFWSYKLTDSSRQKNLILLLLVLFALSAFFVLRTRSYFLLFLLPLFIFDFSFAGETIKVWKRLLALATLAFIALSMRYLRGWMEYGNVVAESSKGRIFELYLWNSDLFFGSRIIQSLELAERFNLELQGQSYYRIFFAVIPRFLWPDKPENTQQIIGDLYPDMPDYFSSPIGLQGDAYMNFGELYFIIPILVGLSLRLVDKYFRWSVMFVPVMIIPLFHFSRGGFTNPISLMIIVIILSTLVYFSRVTSR